MFQKLHFNTRPNGVGSVGWLGIQSFFGPRFEPPLGNQEAFQASPWKPRSISIHGKLREVFPALKTLLVDIECNLRMKKALALNATILYIISKPNTTNTTTSSTCCRSTYFSLFLDETSAKHGFKASFIVALPFLTMASMTSYKSSIRCSSEQKFSFENSVMPSSDSERASILVV
ncbi:hypothetical protein O6H91_23G046400 [Diphasiastrum complanatum]|uniref:Uncharacterized protein n=1 Tax=Diphasiastrum complanatum TaxID=34168 RepID=A0ACC2AAE6_DIPCM|nr:hypothetical protein O6H91_23G046400 [Diphasiastrum complanatum]